VGSRGDLIVEIDLGHPGLDNRLFTEDELRRSEQQRRGRERARSTA
jgi:hypothetical protein